MVIAGRRADRGAALAEEIGPAETFVRTDITSEDDIASLIANTAETYGRIDCLFNNAGDPGAVGAIETVTHEESNLTMAVHFTGTLLAMKHVAPIMKAQGSGSIINTASTGGHRGGGPLVYAAAKAAVLNLTRCVALGLGESGVRVNSISPGSIATGLLAKLSHLPDDQAERSGDTLRSLFATNQPIPRAGMPDDIVHAALFLAGDESSFLNGSDILVDGGASAGRRWSQTKDRYDLVVKLVRGEPDA